MWMQQIFQNLSLKVSCISSFALRCAELCFTFKYSHCKAIMYSMLYVKHNLALWIFIMRANDDIYPLEKPVCLDFPCYIRKAEIKRQICSRMFCNYWNKAARKHENSTHILNTVQSLCLYFYLVFWSAKFYSNAIQNSFKGPHLTQFTC